MKVGLTGGIACGKSTAGRWFEKQGWSVLSTDAIVAELYREDVGLADALVERFGEGIRLAEGGIDRRVLGPIVFADKARLRALEALVHPLVRKSWQAQLSARPDGDWLVEIPLLFEKSLEKYFDLTLCVGAGRATQLSRLRERGLSEDEALERLSHQLPLAEKEARADYVITNDGSLGFLELQLSRLLELIKSN